MVGSIIGVGIANQLMSVKTGTSGVDWVQASNVAKTLLFSPLIGFFLAGLLLLIAKAVIKDRRVYEAPEGAAPPPFWILAIREEEDLATPDHSEVAVEVWGHAGFKEEEARQKAKAARQEYEDALRRVLYNF
jgi:phosphate/sulfate permease